MRKGIDDQLSKWTTRLPFSGLRARLLLLLILALLPTHSFILYSVFEARQQAAEYARENALWLTRLMASEQKSLIEVIRQQLQSLAQLSIVRRPEQAALCSQTFATLRKQNGHYANMGVIDLDGVLRCSALAFTGLVNLSDRDYFREVMRTRTFAVGGYQLGSVSGKGSVNLAAPMLDTAGNLQAVVFVALDLGALADRLIETASLPEGSTLSILDGHGTILMRRPDAEKWVGKSLPDAPLIRTILSHGSKEGSAEETGVDGVERLYVFKPVYATAAQQVYISVGIPTSVVFADAQQLFVRALLLMALVTAAVVVVAWFGGDRLVLRPANALMQAARRLRKGDLDARTDLPHTSNEFGQIASSFDDMASALQARESEAVRAREEIHRLNADLERKVIERTAELAAANQELEAFSYSVSHDLRAPLRSIDGFSQAVLEDCADQLGDQGRGHLNRVRAATQHMGHLIDDLLKLARVTRAEMKREAVDLSALAGGVLADLQTSAPERKMDWQVEPNLVASGDAPLLRVVLDNLLGNAWKFTGKQTHARIEFGALEQATGGQAYFVRDNGVGFDMTYAGKLFGAFQRLHSVSEFPGTGIGLATVQRIVRRHGGRVWAEGAAGKGATFYFSL